MLLFSQESRWKVFGVAMVVAAVLVAGAAAQSQLSHTSLAVSLPLGELAAVASSEQDNASSEVPRTLASVDSSLEKHHRELSPEDVSNELVQITPVKLTQVGTPEILDKTSQDPGKLSSEADEPFFIVVNDVTADIEGPQTNTNIPSDDLEASTSSTAEVQDAGAIPGEDDPLSTQHFSNVVDDTSQNIVSPDDDADTTDPSVVSGERGAKAITDVVAPADAEEFQPPFVEDQIFPFEQSFDTISEEVFTESTPASTLPIEGQFQDLSLRTDEAPPTETPVTVSFSDMTIEDVLPTDPSTVDSQTPSELSLEQTSDVVLGEISAQERTPELTPSETFVKEPSPAPIPVRIILDEPDPDTVLEKLSLEEATLGQVSHEIPEVTTHEDAREFHDLEAPQTQLETGNAEAELSGLRIIGESTQSHDPIHSPSDINNPGSVTIEEPHNDFMSHSGMSNVARFVEVTPTALGNHDEINKAAEVAASGSTSESQLGLGHVSNDEVLLVQDLPQGTRTAPEDTLDPFAPEIENFNPDPPIDDKVRANSLYILEIMIIMIMPI